MKVLIIGGTGTISSAVSKLAAETFGEVYLLNRGRHSDLMPHGARFIEGDINEEDDVRAKLSRLNFDAVVDFLVFNREQAQRDFRLFGGRCGQYVFISSAAAYRKPSAGPVLCESTPLANPYWEYGENKADCERYFSERLRADGFPVTVVRPSHTYGPRNLPVAVHGRGGFYSVLQRIIAGKKVIVHGDGTSIWAVTHNTDFARGLVGLLGNPAAVGETYHITSDELLTWNGIYRVIGACVGVEPRIEHIPSETLAKVAPGYRGALLGDKAESVIFDNSKIRRAVPGFAATVPFHRGVRESVSYILSHPDEYRTDPEFDAFCDAICDSYDRLTDSLPKYDN